MNITTSYAFNRNNVNFGMARFTQRGYEYAKSCSDTYEPFNKKNEYLDNDFYKKKHLFMGTKFEKFVKKAYKENSSKDAVEKIAKTMIEYGCTDNSKNNAAFIKQVQKTGAKKLGLKDSSKLSDEDKKIIQNALSMLLEKNWDNPSLNEKETLKLLELTSDGLSDKEIVVFDGVIKNSKNKK